ncbi:MAG: CBS domain-containing protein [Candidatus Atribacteria bacterium]|nr:CBS domain-containing protein [Candidatus Atribacteria bacterium]
MNILQSGEKLTLAHELIYQLKIENAMTRKVIFLSEDVTFREIQQSLKKNRMPGTPILYEAKKVIGIISLDDAITTLDENYITEKIKDYMSKDVIAIPQNHSPVSAIKKFEKYKYGQLPVTENTHSPKIVEILTMGDFSKNHYDLKQERLISIMLVDLLVL